MMSYTPTHASETLRERRGRPPLTICESAKEQLPEIVSSFILDISQTLATAQDFVENGLIGTEAGNILSCQSPHLTSAFVTCNDMLKHMSVQVDTFENFLKYGVELKTTITNETLFNPGDMNQQIADVMSIYASSKSIEVVVNNPYQGLITGGYELYLVFFDQDFLRQMMVHV